MKAALLWIGAHVLSAVAQAAPSAAEPFELSRVRLLDGPFKQIQELHRTGLVGQLEPDKLLFGFHHHSHAASAFLPSPFESAAILVMDGVGEWATTTIGRGHGAKVDLLSEVRFPHSLGLLYSAFTYYLGFKPNSAEYKVMGLAPYGDPKYVDLITKHLIDIREDGSYWMDMQYFNYCQGLTMTNKKFDQLFGAPRREPESELTQREMDIAASLQVVTERAMINIARYARKRTGTLDSASYSSMKG